MIRPRARAVVVGAAGVGKSELIASALAVLGLEATAVTWDLRSFFLSMRGFLPNGRSDYGRRKKEQLSLLVELQAFQRLQQLELV